MRVGADDPIRVRRVGEGYGLASVVARVDVGAASFAVKLCEAGAARAEAHAYTHVLPGAPGVRHPRFVRAEDDAERGLVITGFVDGVQGDVLTGCAPGIARDLTRMVARLHTAWWQRAVPGLDPVDVRRLRPLSDGEIERCLADHGDVLSSRGRELLGDLPNRLDGAAERLAAQPFTALHADLHLDNVLIDEDGPVLLDWAGPRSGPAAIDVARCLVEFTDLAGGEIEGLVDQYTDEIRRHGIDEPPGFRSAVDAALVAAVAPSVRWAVRHELRPDTREWRLFRFGLRRIDALLAR